ncbi:MAG: PEP-CTERM sorting domain-containing protein [Phycisphaerae bacterium]|nr:PEP-CTERM sorting domain-containing protein [Phycisphaerae bacterium]
MKKAVFALIAAMLVVSATPVFAEPAFDEGYGLIALSEYEVGLVVHGMPELAIEGGGIYVNSGLDNGFEAIGLPFGSGESLLSVINVVGGYDISDKVLGYLQTTNNGAPTILRTNLDPIEDPLSIFPEPSLLLESPTAPIDGSRLSIYDGVHTLQPGYYPGGIDIAGGNVTLLPGIYQIGGDMYGRGLHITGGNVYADQVMFHMLDGGVDVRGNAQMTLSAPTSGDYEGISIFQSRTNYNDSEINGAGGLDLTGKLYFPNNHLSLAGYGDTIGSQIIADTVDIGGNGLINIPYNPVPEPATLSLLALGGLTVLRRRK